MKAGHDYQRKNRLSFGHTFQRVLLESYHYVSLLSLRPRPISLGFPGDGFQTDGKSYLSLS